MTEPGEQPLPSLPLLTKNRSSITRQAKSADPSRLGRFQASPTWSTFSCESTKVHRGRLFRPSPWTEQVFMFPEQPRTNCRVASSLPYSLLKKPFNGRNRRSTNWRFSEETHRVSDGRSFTTNADVVRFDGILDDKARYALQKEVVPKRPITSQVKLAGYRWNEMDSITIVDLDAFRRKHRLCLCNKRMKLNSLVRL